MQLELTALGVRCRLQLLDLLGQHLGRLHGLGCLCDQGLPLGERRAGLLVVGLAYLPGRFRLLLLIFGLRVALLPLPLLALRLRAILLTVHGDRFPYPVGKEKACSRFHVGSRLLVRHKWRLRRGLRLISLNGYLLELLKVSAKNLYAEYERNEELELPVGWRWIEVDEISKMVCRGITPKYNPNSDETVLGQTCVRNNLVLLENGRLHLPKKVTEKWLQKYDLLINSTGIGSLGRTAQIWFEPTKLVVDSHVTIVRCKDGKHALYLGFWAFEHEKYIESLHTGSTGQTELPRDHVKAIRLVLPSDEALERFNKMSEPSVELIAANQEESKRLADLRDALLPKLVSGEIDVSRIDLTQLNSHLEERIEAILQSVRQSHLTLDSSRHFTRSKFFKRCFKLIFCLEQLYPALILTHRSCSLFERAMPMCSDSLHLSESHFISV